MYCEVFSLALFVKVVDKIGQLDIDCCEMIKLRILLICGLIFSFFQIPLYPQNSEITQSREELAKIRERLYECRQRREEIDEAKKSTLARIEIISEELNITKKLIEALRKEESSLKEEVLVLQKRIDRIETDLSTRKSVLAERLRETYKHGKAHDLELILFSKSLSDVVKKIKYILLIAGQDKKLIDSTRVLVQASIKERERLMEKIARESKLREEKEKEKKKMETEKGVKEEMLQKLRKEKEEKVKLESELEEVEKRMVELIERLERERRSNHLFEGISFSKYKGKLRWPAAGKVISKFGKKRHPVYWTVTQNNGIDIEAGYGAPVYAVAKGKIVYAERFLGYSKVVLLDHGEGYYTLYAYLSEILVPTGAIVNEGEVIAYLGDSLNGGLLHFEVRKKGKPKDPLNWLQPK